MQSLAQPTRPALTDPASRVKALSQQAQQLLDRQQLDSAWRYALKPGLALLTKLTESDSAHRVIRQLTATYYHRHRDFASAIRELNTLVRLNQAAKDTAQLIKSRYRLSVIYSNLGLNQQAIAQSFATLRLLANGDKPMEQSAAYSILMVNYQELGDSVRSAHYAGLTAQYARLNRNQNPGWSLLLEAEKNGDAKKYALAIRQLRQFIRIQAQRHTRENVTYSQLKIAEYHKQANQTDQARGVVEKAIESARQDHELTAESEGYNLLADLLLQQGKPAKAIRAARQSVALAGQSGHIVLRPDALKTLAKAQEYAGQYQNALQTVHQLQHLTDSLHTANKIEVIAATQAVFNVEQKDSQIKLLNQNLIIKELEKEQQWLLGWVIIGSLFMGVTITVFFLRRSNRQKHEIATQAAQLAELNGMKDRLFSIVSHDLRGPVMSLQQSLDRLETASSATQPDALPRFRQSVNAVAALTDNVLCWALSQMGGLRTRPQTVALTDLVADVLALYQETIRQKNIDFIMPDEHAGEAPPLVLADENQAEIAIRNIVQNALKFSPTGSRLTVSFEQQVNQVSLLVADEGPGFEWQSGNTGTTRASSNSTGLGLTVVEDLMRRNGGELQISRRMAGTTGTVVRLTWPAPEIQKTTGTTHAIHAVAP